MGKVAVPDISGSGVANAKLHKSNKKENIDDGWRKKGSGTGMGIGREGWGEEGGSWDFWS